MDKTAQKLYQKKYYLKHKGHILQYQRQYRETHESELKEYRDYQNRRRKYHRNDCNTPVDYFMRRNKLKFNEGQKLDY